MSRYARAIHRFEVNVEPTHILDTRPPLEAHSWNPSKQVTVPPGTAPGALLSVQTPVGMRQVQVPTGCGAGSTFLFAVESPLARPEQPSARQNKDKCKLQAFPSHTAAS